jgi:toxin ParE1/3/4
MDRDAQLDYIALDNPIAALNQGDRISAQVDTLLQHPRLDRPGRRAGTRELVISRTPFIVVYRIQGERVELLRLLRGAQQWR